LRANVHRVVSPPAGEDRLSIAFFLGAHLDARVPQLQLPPHLAALSRGLTQDPLNPLFAEMLGSTQYVTPTLVIRSISRRAFGLRRDGVKQVGVMAQRDIGMRTQAALQHVAADFANERSF
jgi:hypothetical protein